MRPHQFQTDRSEALRRQLVELPTLPGAEDPVRFGRARATAELLDRRTEATSATDLQAGETAPPHRPHRTRRALLAAAATCIGALVIGQVNMTAQSAHAADILRAAAEQSVTFTDPTPGPGQYLLVHTEASNIGGKRDDAGNDVYQKFTQTIDVYVPADPDEEWVLDREMPPAGWLPGWEELIHAQHGEFYDGHPWSMLDQRELEALPRDGKALLEHFDAQYVGGSTSREEDNFVRITDLLRRGLVPADLRAGLYEALALIPGVTATEQTNLDGKEGIAIGRTEPLRAGQRQEVIIDPDTGLVIGERTIMTYAAFGFGTNEVTGHTAIDYQIVESAPNK